MTDYKKHWDVIALRLSVIIFTIIFWVSVIKVIF